MATYIIKTRVIVHSSNDRDVQTALVQALLTNEVFVEILDVEVEKER